GWKCAQRANQGLKRWALGDGLATVLIRVARRVLDASTWFWGHLSGGVLPGSAVIHAHEAVERPGFRTAGVCHQTREDPLQFLRISKLLGNDRGRVGLVHHVVPKKRISIPPLVPEHILDQPREKRYVVASPDGRMQVGNAHAAA